MHPLACLLHAPAETWMIESGGADLWACCSISAYADWALLSSEVATVATIPIDTANGLVGTATFASAKGAVLDTESICWFAALLGQCLVHCKCKADLQVGSVVFAFALGLDSQRPIEASNLWPAWLAHAPGSRTFTLSCQVCAAINPVTVTPADLGLQAVVPHPVSTPAAGPKLCQACLQITSANIGDAWRLQRVSKQQQLPKVDGQRPEATSSRQSPKLAHELRPSCPPSALTHGQQQWQWCWLPALGLLAVVVAACSTEQGLERLHATSQWHWQCLQLLSCCLGMATLGCIAALGLLQRQHVTVSGLGLWMLAHAWLPCGWHLWALLATLVRSLG
ncbi:hypothetical protein MMC29_000023 [Sticta canariensis]|nr:hypothetical protein [Sticta canariensis]